jgi:hypothetical protein
MLCDFSIHFAALDYSLNHVVPHSHAGSAIKPPRAGVFKFVVVVVVAVVGDCSAVGLEGWGGRFGRYCESPDLGTIL